MKSSRFTFFLMSLLVGAAFFLFPKIVFGNQLPSTASLFIGTWTSELRPFRRIIVEFNEKEKALFGRYTTVNYNKKHPNNKATFIEDLKIKFYSDWNFTFELNLKDFASGKKVCGMLRWAKESVSDKLCLDPATAVDFKFNSGYVCKGKKIISLPNFSIIAPESTDRGFEEDHAKDLLGTWKSCSCLCQKSCDGYEIHIERDFFKELIFFVHEFKGRELKKSESGVALLVEDDGYYFVYEKKDYFFYLDKGIKIKAKVFKDQGKKSHDFCMIKKGAK